MASASSIRSDLGWELKGRFLQEQIKNLYQAAVDLAAFADQNTAGQGRNWLRKVLTPLRLHTKGLTGAVISFVNRKPTSIVFPRTDIWLAGLFERKPDPLVHIVHELAHVIDNHLSRRRLPATIFGGGPADRLVRSLGGHPRGLRFSNGVCGLDEQYLWTVNNGYGNRASAEYFAETLAWCVYDPDRLPAPILLEWVEQNLFKF
jgi:hypothetical protein